MSVLPDAAGTHRGSVCHASFQSLQRQRDQRVPVGGLHEITSYQLALGDRELRPEEVLFHSRHPTLGVKQALKVHCAPP